LYLSVSPTKAALKTRLLLLSSVRQKPTSLDVLVFGSLM